MTYLSQVSMPRFSRYLTAAVLTIGLFAVGALSNPASAPATGPTKANSCSNVAGGPNHKVTCLGTIDGNSVTINIDLLSNSLNDIQLNLLVVKLTDVLINALVFGDIQLQVNNIASGTVIVLKDVLNINVCQVKVIELGKVNNNIALCHQ
jgi:hypothetical protein